MWPFFFEPMYREAAVLLLPPIWRCAFEVEISMYGKRKVKRSLLLLLYELVHLHAPLIVSAFAGDNDALAKREVITLRRQEEIGRKEQHQIHTIKVY